MSNEFTAIDADMTLLTLSYATRLLASETDLDKLIQIALDTLSDFGRSNRVEFISIEGDLNHATVLGRLTDGVFKKSDIEVSIEGTFLEKVLESKRPGTYKDSSGVGRLCMPLIGSENNVDGLVILDLTDDEQLKDLEMQILVILTTLIAISFEQTKYYQMAMFDGLTGLFVRRQIDAKLQEEMARVRRYGGVVSIFMVDIDNFKQVNDTYGHLQGDIVLQELAGVLRKTVRKDVDIPCRYGGEELVTIMPNTDAEGAYELTERFRRNCEKFKFSGQKKPLKVTVSGGVATFDSVTDITLEQFIERADTVLYEAKEAGRNKVISWKG